MNDEPGSLCIVDDDDGDRFLLRRYFEGRGFLVTDAPDGEQALALIGKEPFDVVLLDVVMPGLSGLEVLERLRRTRSLTELPIIMATSKDLGTDVIEALRLGSNDYVTKPFDLPVVLARVRTQLTLKRSVEKITRLERSLAQRNAELEQANKKLRQDLEAAARVQQALLPTHPLEYHEARFDWRFRPCAELAGDLLNVIVLDDDHIGMYVLDVVGHGVKAALLAVMISRVLGEMLAPGTRGEPAGRRLLAPSEVTARLNSAFPWDDRTQQFCTLLYGILELPSGVFRFVSAGHPGPIHLPAEGPPRAIDMPGEMIGLANGHYEEASLSLESGDRLYLYSDGLPDAANAARQRFDLKRILDNLEQARTVPLTQGLNSLMQAIEGWCGDVAPHDDISVLAIERA